MAKGTWMATVLVLLLAAGLTIGVKDLLVDNDIRHMVPQDHPDMAWCDEVDELFGATDAIIVALPSRAGITAPVLTALRRMCERLSDETEEVISIPTTDTIVAKEGMLKPTPLLPDGPLDADAVQVVRARLDDWPMFRNMLVSGDGRTPSLLVTVPGNWTLPEREAAVRKVRKVVGEEWSAAGQAEEPVFAGEPVINLEMGERVNADLTLLSPFALIVVLFILILSFRSVPAVVGPVLTVAVAVGATFGLMGLLGRPVMVISSAIPVFLVAVGSAYGIHVVAHFRRYLQQGLAHREAASKTLRSVGPAVVAAALTTVMGFLSLGVTRIVPMRDFGLFLAFGIFMALLASLTLVPLLMHTARIPGNRSTGNTTDDDGLARALTGLTRWTLRHRAGVVAAGLLLLVAFLTIAVSWLRVDEDAVGMFPSDSGVRRADTYFTDEFGGTHTLSIVVTGTRDRAMLEPAILQFMAGLQDELHKHPLVGKTTSLADFVRRMNTVMHDGDPAFDTVPDSKALVAQYMQLYELSGDPDDFAKVVDFAYRQGHLLVQLRSGAASVTRTFQELLDRYAEEHLPPGYDLDLAGTVVRYDIVNSFLVSSQLWSLGLSLVMVFLVVSLLFFLRRKDNAGRDRAAHALAAGAMTLLPIVLAVVTNFGLMALFDIALEVGTAIIAACAVGIGIDYSVHYLHRYETGRAVGLAVDDAAVFAARTSGKPILYNAAAVAAGFLTLLFSGFLPVRYLGWLTAVTMVVTSLAALTLLPALLSFRDRGRESAE